MMEVNGLNIKTMIVTFKDGYGGLKTGCILDKYRGMSNNQIYNEFPDSNVGTRDCKQQSFVDFYIIKAIGEDNIYHIECSNIVSVKNIPVGD